MRKEPNILICGTPGVGKTTFAQRIGESLEMEHIEIGKLIREKKLYQEWDDERNCSIFDEDMLIEELEGMLAKGNCVVDFHSVDFFPAEWFDMVVVLRTENDQLWKRLEARKYDEAKIRENCECEIFQTILDECTEHFDPDIVFQVPSNSTEDLAKNEAKMKAWRKQWQP